MNEIKIIDNKKYILNNGKWIRDLDSQKIIELYNDKKSIFEIAKEFKTDSRNIKKILIENNIEIRSHKEQAKLSMNRKDVKNRLKDSYKTSDQKRKETCLKKFGTEYASQSQEFKNKVIETSQKKYGCDHFLSSKEVKDKRIITCREKYNVDYVSQIDCVKERIKENTLQNYGVEYIFQRTDVKQKIQNTLLEKYNETNVSKVSVFKIKREKTMTEKYGYRNAMNVEIFKNKVANKLKTEFIKSRDIILKLLKINLLDCEYIHAHYIHNWKCENCKNEFKSSWNYIQQGNRCPSCYPKQNGISKLEIELQEYIKEIYNEDDLLFNVRNIIYPKELDIFIPSKKIAIEFDGLYWHSEQINNNINLHLDKTIECEKQGIQLIHIFEDEWIFKKDIVKNRLLNIIGSNKNKTIYARKCIIKEIDSAIKNKFLEQNHIQGKDNSVIKLGAFYNDELVSVMTFSHGNIAKGSKSIEGVWELNRFCSDYNYHIPGIASKLLTHFKRNYEWKEIFSYADKRWSSGNLYEKLGFKLEYITNPNYWYVKGLIRSHRFGLRKRPDEPKDIPEWALRQAEGYYKLWDCGNIKFIMNNSEVFKCHKY